MIHIGDCLTVLPTLDASSIDSIVTDPPYGLGFMGKAWDHAVPGEPFWREMIRVAKPGAYLVAFGGTRTFHRMACAIEDAGWELRDTLMWVYGSGFPKSLDVSKAIDKAAGAERSVLGKVAGMGKQNPEWNGTAAGRAENSFKPEYDLTAPATDDAKQWQGWGTALKPAWEPIILARKPLIGTVAANVLAHGTGGLNIDGCRVGGEGGTTKRGQREGTADSVSAYGNGLNGGGPRPIDAGRWPANLVHDGSDEVVALFPQTVPSPSGMITQGGRNGGGFDVGSSDATRAGKFLGHGDSGSAARFFKQFELTDEDWICGALLLVPNVEGCFCLQSPSVASALSAAATSDLPEGMQCDVVKAPSTPVTPSELRRISEALTETIQRSARAFWLGSLQGKPSPSSSHARSAVSHEPTGTTTITVSHWSSDGSAEPVTFSITATNSEAGGKDCERFRYCAKADRDDRNDGCDGMPEGMPRGLGVGDIAVGAQRGSLSLPRANVHPTVKPTELMRWLCRLVTPPGGTVLDPFTGSGSTWRAAIAEGMEFVGIELDPEYAAIAKARMHVVQPGFSFK